MSSTSVSIGLKNIPYFLPVVYLYTDFEYLNNNYLRLETKQKWYGIEKRPSHYFTGPLIYNHIECLVQDWSDCIAIYCRYIKPSI